MPATAEMRLPTLGPTNRNLNALSLSGSPCPESAFSVSAGSGLALRGSAAPALRAAKLPKTAISTSEWRLVLIVRMRFPFEKERHLTSAHPPATNRTYFRLCQTARTAPRQCARSFNHGEP